MAQAVGKQMIKQNTGGSIIQTSSIYGIMGPDHRIYKNSLLNGNFMGTPAVYSFTKSGVIGLTKYLATYWADNKIRVNTITPGGVEDEQNERLSKVKDKRNSNDVKESLLKIQDCCKTNENLMPAIIAAVESYATLGEIVDSMKDVFGEWQEKVFF